MNRTEYYIKRTRAAAKEVELDVSSDLRAVKNVEVEKLFPKIISWIGDAAAKIVSTHSENKITEAERSNLRATARYLISYSYINCYNGYDNYLLLLGAVAAYLCDLVGDATLLASKITDEEHEGRLFELLVRILRNEESNFNGEHTFYYDKALDEYIFAFNNCINSGISIPIEKEKPLQKIVYRYGSDRELIIVDMLLAVGSLKANYSVSSMLSSNKFISEDKKRNLIENKAIVKEFWPAQRIMAKEGFFSGQSGVVQFPTGAGKTKAIALCIYSMLSANTNGISVVVSPFRALCREISDSITRDLSFDRNITVVELSDLIQHDYEIENIESEDVRKVIIVTPEKLLYIIRHEPDLSEYIMQIIFDEGHMFQDETRGANYELLISSILPTLPVGAQIILISAIVGGAETVNKWITQGKGQVISENAVPSTDKYTAALSKKNINGKHYLYLEYLGEDNLNEIDFYVPRFIERVELPTRSKTKKKFFPGESHDASIATLLRLIRHDNCAIFCGRKDSANVIAKRLIQISKYVDISVISQRNDSEEQGKLCNLIKENYGEKSVYYTAALQGLFIHHGDVSDGVKSSIEYAMQHADITSVVCTSTLSQGVNLPIKYLIIDGLYQGKKMITDQDYRNLIGRIGRSGMYTEGTVIFADYESYTSKDWRWKKFADLSRKQGNYCYSQLLSQCHLVNQFQIKIQWFSFRESHCFFSSKT
jgi:POLQ-like helicase